MNIYVTPIAPQVWTNIIETWLGFTKVKHASPQPPNPREISRRKHQMETHVCMAKISTTSEGDRNLIQNKQVHILHTAF